MTSRFVMAAMLGFVVGNLPDHAPVWTGIKLAFTVVALILVVRSGRREEAERGST